MAGKGDRPRPVDAVKYREGWERTFGSVRFDLRPARPYGIDREAETTTTFLRGFRAAQPARLPGDRHG